MNRKQIKELDKLWSRVIRLRDKFCQRCGKTVPLAGHHIKTKGRYRSVRWNLLNGVCLCSGCHIFWIHKELTDGTEWVKKWMGSSRYGLLKQKANHIKPYLDYETIKFSLENEIKKYEKL